MAGQTLAQLTPILKEVYENGITDQLNNETTAWNRVKRSVKKSDRFGGKYIDFPIHVSRNNGIGSRNEGEALPEAGRQGYEEAHVKWGHHYASIELTGQAIELAETDYQSFASTLAEEKSRVMNDIVRERNRQFFGDGSGARATVTSVSGTTIGINDLNGIDFGGIYDIYNPSGNGTLRGTVTVTDYDDDDPAAHTVTVSSAPSGVAEGDVLVRKGSWNKEIQGLGNIISRDTELYGIDPNKVKLWRSQVHGDASNPTQIDEMRLTRMADAIKRYGSETTVMYTRADIMRAYFSLLTSQRRFVNTQKFQSGHTGIAFQSPSGGEVPFVVEGDVPKGEILFVNEKDLTFYARHEGFKFMDRTGSMWHQKTDANGRYDVYGATMYEYSQLAAKRRNTHGKIVGVLGDVEQ